MSIYKNRCSFHAGFVHWWGLHHFTLQLVALMPEFLRMSNGEKCPIILVGQFASTNYCG